MKRNRRNPAHPARRTKPTKKQKWETVTWKVPGTDTVTTTTRGLLHDLWAVFEAPETANMLPYKKLSQLYSGLLRTYVRLVRAKVPELHTPESDKRFCFTFKEISDPWNTRLPKPDQFIQDLFERVVYEHEKPPTFAEKMKKVKGYKDPGWEDYTIADWHVDNPHPGYPPVKFTEPWDDMLPTDQEQLIKWGANPIWHQEFNRVAHLMVSDKWEVYVAQDGNKATGPHLWIMALDSRDQGEDYEKLIGNKVLAHQSPMNKMMTKVCPDYYGRIQKLPSEVRYKVTHTYDMGLDQIDTLLEEHGVPVFEFKR